MKVSVTVGIMVALVANIGHGAGIGAADPLPQSYGVYALNKGKLLQLWGNSRTVCTIFSGDVKLIIYDKRLSDPSADLKCIWLDDWRLLGYEPRGFVKCDVKRVDKQAEMVVVTPLQKLRPGLYSINVDQIKLGKEYYFGVDTRDVITFWKEVLQENPLSWQAHNHLGAEIYMANNDFDGALKHFEEAVRINPNSCEAHHNVGLTLLALRKPNEAVIEFREAVQIKGQVPTLRWDLADCLSRMGKLDEAAEQYKASFAISPNALFGGSNDERFAAAHASYGYTLSKLGRMQEAITELQESLRLHPKNNRVQQNLEAAKAAVAKDEAEQQTKPLWKAALDGNVARVTQLLDQGDPIDYQNPQFQATALMYAAGTNRSAVVRVLVEHRAQVNLKNNKGETALYIAASNGFGDSASVLLDAGADPNIASNDGNTPLMMSVCQTDTTVLKQLLATKVDLNAMNQKGESALMLAAWRGWRNSVELLLKAGVDLNLENADGETALIKAGQRGHRELVNDLTCAGAKRTQIFLNKSRERDESLTPAQRWALATCALMLQWNGESHETLDFGPPGKKQHYIRELKSGWGIQSREDLFSMLERSLREGMRKRLQKDLLAEASVKGATDDFDAAFHKAKPVATLPPGEHEAFLAWDLCRYVSLVRGGVTAGYLTREEAWQKIMPVAKRIQANYRSWEEMGQDYLAGRDRWYHGPDLRYRAIYELLINKNDPNSPWNKCPWETALE